MRPSVRTLDFSTNENGTNTYFYRRNGRLMVQLSWQTCRPHYHFRKRIREVNSNLWNYYPLEMSYDWFYDYHVNNICLHETKYHHAPKSVRMWLQGRDPFLYIIDPNNILNLARPHYVVSFDDRTKPPYPHGKSLIGLRNQKIAKVLKKIAHFQITLYPTPALLQYDNMALNEVIDYIHHKNSEAMVLNGHISNPFEANNKSDDAIMQLVGFGFNALTIMRKIWRAKTKID